MSNNILTTQGIAREALPILMDNLVFPTLAHTDFSADYCKTGDTVMVRKPSVFTAAEFETEIAAQDLSEGSVAVTLDKIADVSVELSAKDMALSVSDFSAQILVPAMSAIAEKINSDGLALYRDIPYTIGTAGTTPAALSVFADAAKALNKAKAPALDRAAVWDIEAISRFQTIGDIVNAEKCGENTALREGSIGRIFGISNYMSQGVKQHVAGTLAGETGVKVSAQVTAGATSLVLTGSGNLKKGDILTISGSNYVVTADASASGSTVTASVYPALPAISANTAVSVAASHTANLAFHKYAFAFVTRPLEPAHGADSYVTSFGGVTLRVTMDYDIAHKKQILSIDTLYGVKTLYPELAVRVLG